jgi:hypothetical protein
MIEVVYVEVPYCPARSRAAEPHRPSGGRKRGYPRRKNRISRSSLPCLYAERNQTESTPSTQGLLPTCPGRESPPPLVCASEGSSARREHDPLTAVRGSRNAEGLERRRLCFTQGNLLRGGSRISRTSYAGGRIARKERGCFHLLAQSASGCVDSKPGSWRRVRRSATEGSSSCCAGCGSLPPLEELEGRRPSGVQAACRGPGICSCSGCTSPKVAVCSPSISAGQAANILVKRLENRSEAEPDTINRLKKTHWVMERCSSLFEAFARMLRHKEHRSKAQTLRIFRTRRPS